MKTLLLAILFTLQSHGQCRIHFIGPDGSKHVGQWVPCKIARQRVAEQFRNHGQAAQFRIQRKHWWNR